MEKIFKRPVLTGLVLAIVLALAGCGEEKKQQAGTERMAEVLAVHDQVMPEMETIGKLVAQLKPLADSSATGSPYRNAMEDLQEAHRSMMDWMKGFGDRFDHAEIMEGKALTPEKQEWLKEEQLKVESMRDKVYNSIEQARRVLEEHQE